MAKPKCWSETVGARRGARVRIYERTPGGLLHASVWRPGEGERRRSLGYRDKNRARNESAALLLMRYTATEADRDPPIVTTPAPIAENPAPPSAGQPALTLSDLLRRYRKAASAGDDGCLKTEGHLGDLDRRARYLERYFGSGRAVGTITPDDWKAYAQKRRSGGINGRKVGTRSIRGDLLLLTAVLRWASSANHGVTPLLTFNPLAGMTLPTERDPRRPMLHDKTIEKLIVACAEVDADRLPVLIAVIQYTGRRLSSCLALERRDIDFELDQILWRAEADKRRKTRVSPLPSPLRPTLQAYLERHADDESQYVFPNPLDPERHLDKDRADGLLQSLYKAANIERPRGGLWHPFRRRWATRRKKLPLSDVAQAGGWDDVRTLLTCYQLADPETLREVADFDA